jgi:hypothetical protein
MSVIWIRLEKPSFDLIGVVMSSFGIAGICIGVAVLLGCCGGVALIRRGRARRPFQADVTLGLDAALR